MRALLAIAVSTVAIGTPAHAQRGPRVRIEPNVPYDGRFTFVRLSYHVYGHSGWEFDYPAMERNFMTILKDLSTVRAHFRESNIHAMDDPQLSHYPIAYLSEPGWWHPSVSEATGLRTWLAKGGFLIVDDFYFQQQWANFENSMRQVLPEGRIVKLDVSHPIFNSFFHIKTLEGMTHPDNKNAKAEYLGIYENNASSELRVHRGTDLIERLSRLVQAHCEPTLPLANGTLLRHRVLALVTGEQGIEAVIMRAAAVATDAVDHLGHLAHGVKQIDQLRLGRQLFARCDLRARDPGARRRVRIA